MNSEKPPIDGRNSISADVNVELIPGSEVLVPSEFSSNPLEYFETKGVPVKTGVIERDQDGKIHEDPTAVREMVWTDVAGNEYRVVGKITNPLKGELAASGDPFYESRVMELVRGAGLPAPKLIARVTQGEAHIFVSERVPGYRWSRQSEVELRAQGYTNDNIADLHQQAMNKMDALRLEFERAGISRSWKLGDMIIDIDINNKMVSGVVPTDWERTIIDEARLEAYKQTVANL